MTLTVSFIEIRFKLESALTLIFDLPKMFPLGTERFGKAIGESESHELGQSGLIPVWQITALVPTSESFSRSF
jgi:hypothetical protein